MRSMTWRVLSISSYQKRAFMSDAATNSMRGSTTARSHSHSGSENIAVPGSPARRGSTRPSPWRS